MTVSKRKFILILGLAAIVCLLTVPRLLINFGMDGDSMRGVKAGEDLLRTGVYQPSRLPSNPLFEYLLAIITPWGGHIASNLFVLTMFVMGIIAFWQLAKSRREGLLLTGIFALTPILLLNAATTMDYLPGLALLLWSYVCASRKQLVLSGVLLGLSIGFRPSNALFFVPLILFALLKRARIPTVVIFALVTVLVGLSFYIPVFARYGFTMLALPKSIYGPLDYLLRTIYQALSLFGPLGTIGVLLASLASARHIPAAFRDLRAAPDLVVELVSCILYVVLFVTHSDEAAYLIPAIPFLYLLMARWLSRRQLILVGMLVFSFSFFTVELKGGEAGQRRLAFGPTWGILVQDYTGRREVELLRSGINRFDYAPKSVVLTGMGPILTYRNLLVRPASYEEISPRLAKDGIWEASRIYRLADREVYLIYALSKDNCLLLQKEGYRVYIFSDSAPGVILDKYKYNPYDIDIIRLDVMSMNAFYRISS